MNTKGHKEIKNMKTILSFILLILLFSCQQKYVVIDDSVAHFPDSLFSNSFRIGETNEIEIYLNDSSIQLSSTIDTIVYLYREIHKYISKKDSTIFSVPHQALDTHGVRHPMTGELMSLDERVRCFGFLKESENSRVLKCFTTSDGQMTFNSKGTLLDTIYIGMPFYSYNGNDLIGPIIAVMSPKLSSKKLDENYIGVDYSTLKLSSVNCMDAIFFDLLKSFYSKNSHEILKQDSTYIFPFVKVKDFNNQIKAKITYSKYTTYNLVVQIKDLLEYMNIRRIKVYEKK